MIGDESIFPNFEITKDHAIFSGGLTKRELAAMLAMNALLSNSSDYDFWIRTKIMTKELRENISDISVQFADALLKSLSKTPEEK